MQAGAFFRAARGSMREPTLRQLLAQTEAAHAQGDDEFFLMNLATLVNRLIWNRKPLPQDVPEGVRKEFAQLEKKEIQVCELLEKKGLIDPEWREVLRLPPRS